jgi:hypothetical protein
MRDAMARLLLQFRMLNLLAINRALDRLGEAAFVPRTRVLRPVYVIPESRWLSPDERARRLQSLRARRTIR